MNNRIILSFIIPMYNSEDSISDLLNSIFSQKFLPEIEIIIVDDGSTDDSAQVVSEFQRKYPQIELIQQSNKKQAEARNNGLKHATGQFVCFVDSDDVLYENYLECLLLPLLENENYLLAFGGIVKKDSQSGVQIVEDTSVLLKSKNDKNMIDLYLTRNREMDVGLWNKIFVNSVIKSHGLKFSNDNFFEDSLFVLKYLKLISYKNIYFYNHPVYELTKAENSTTTSFKKEIDNLALRYLGHVKGTQVSKSTLQSLSIRTALHVIHHHIKYDINWTNALQRKIFRDFGINFPINRKLSVKYNIGAFLAWVAPSLYRRMYG